MFATFLSLFSFISDLFLSDILWIIQIVIHNNALIIKYRSLNIFIITVNHIFRSLFVCK
jgi:hypothetical protein